MKKRGDAVLRPSPARISCVTRIGRLPSGGGSMKSGLHRRSGPRTNLWASISNSCQPQERMNQFVAVPGLPLDKRANVARIILINLLKDRDQWFGCDKLSQDDVIAQCDYEVVNSLNDETSEFFSDSEAYSSDSESAAFVGEGFVPVVKVLPTPKAVSKNYDLEAQLSNESLGNADYMLRCLPGISTSSNSNSKSEKNVAKPEDLPDKEIVQELRTNRPTFPLLFEKKEDVNSSHEDSSSKLKVVRPAAEKAELFANNNGCVTSLEDVLKKNSASCGDESDDSKKFDAPTLFTQNSFSQSPDFSMNFDKPNALDFIRVDNQPMSLQTNQQPSAFTNKSDAPATNILPPFSASAARPAAANLFHNLPASGGVNIKDIQTVLMAVQQNLNASEVNKIINNAKEKLYESYNSLVQTQNGADQNKKEVDMETLTNLTLQTLFASRMAYQNFIERNPNTDTQSYGNYNQIGGAGNGPPFQLAQQGMGFDNLNVNCNAMVDEKVPFLPRQRSDKERLEALQYYGRLNQYALSQNTERGAPQKCTYCGTTQTPTWRRAEDGKKLLCNACGLRQSRSIRARSQQKNESKTSRISHTRPASAPPIPSSSLTIPVTCYADGDESLQPPIASNPLSSSVPLPIAGKKRHVDLCEVARTVKQKPDLNMSSSLSFSQFNFDKDKRFIKVNPSAEVQSFKSIASNILPTPAFSVNHVKSHMMSDNQNSVKFDPSLPVAFDDGNLHALLSHTINPGELLKSIAEKHNMPEFKPVAVCGNSNPLASAAKFNDYEVCSTGMVKPTKDNHEDGQCHESTAGEDQSSAHSSSHTCLNRQMALPLGSVSSCSEGLAASCKSHSPLAGEKVLHASPRSVSPRQADLKSIKDQTDEASQKH